MVDITNQMFIDEKGRRMTRCWTRRSVGGKIITTMYVVPTDEKQIRPFCPCKEARIPPLRGE